jgi:hypothetical protein
MEIPAPDTEEDRVTSHDPTALVDRYLASWNETDPARRRELVVATWTDDGRYVDPRADVAGHDGVDGLLAAVQDAVPGCSFDREGQVDAHHDRVRFQWRLMAPDGATVARGLDVAVMAADGRFAEVSGFLLDVGAGAA